MEKVKVMVVDDSKISRRMLESMLSKTNFEVVALAENGKEALELYAKKHPDVVTMDMNLPDMDGIETSRRIHAIDNHAKIVMISAMKDEKLMAQGRSCGISAFLQKPVQTNELMESLALLCQDSISAHNIYKDAYISTFAKVFQDGLANMLGLKSEIEIIEDNRHTMKLDGILVIIGLSGTPRGRVAYYMSKEANRAFTEMLFKLNGDETEPDEESCEAALEETGNIIAGHGVSRLNDIFKDKEMRLTPPGTISGTGIQLSNPDLIAFNIIAHTKIGDLGMNVGFQKGV